MIERRTVTAWISRSMPVVLVAMLWAGLWQMWPSYEPMRWSAVEKPFTVRLVSRDEAPGMVADPTAFAFDSDVSFRSGDNGHSMELTMPPMHAGRRELLEMSARVLNAPTRDSSSSYSVWDKGGGSFKGEWQERGVFSAREPETQLIVELSDNLVASGYLPAEISTNDFSSAAGGWEVRVLLDVDESGIPSHVLIEKSSGNKDIDAVVCRKVMLGRSAKKEARGGRVKVSYGFE